MEKKTKCECVLCGGPVVALSEADEIKHWNTTFFQAASEIVRLSEIEGTPFNESAQAEHIDVANRLMALCEELP